MQTNIQGKERMFTIYIYVCVYTQKIYPDDKGLMNNSI